MPNKNISHSDAAALAYISTCLLGRARRLSRKWGTLSHQEMFILNQPIYADSDEEYVAQVADAHPPFDKAIVTKLVVEDALSYLTHKEKDIIVQSFWKDQRISQLCRQRNVSKNTILKTKRKALKKLKVCMGE